MVEAAELEARDAKPAEVQQAARECESVARAKLGEPVSTAALASWQKRTLATLLAAGGRIDPDELRLLLRGELEGVDVQRNAECDEAEVDPSTPDPVTPYERLATHGIARDFRDAGPVARGTATVDTIPRSTGIRRTKSADSRSGSASG